MFFNFIEGWTHHVESSYRFDILSIEFIRTEDRFFVPICPVHPIFERCDGERMPKGVSGMDNNIAFGAIVIARGNHI